MLWNSFIALDKPFFWKSVKTAFKCCVTIQDRADISVSEKFRQVLEAYKIESDYGRFLNEYKATLNVGGQDREVNILQVGRVSLMYQTTDTELSGAWDAGQNAWV
jgi:hypothetical protein